MVVSREVVLLKPYGFWAVYLIFDFLFSFECKPVRFLCEYGPLNAFKSVCTRVWKLLFAVKKLIHDDEGCKGNSNVSEMQNLHPRSPATLSRTMWIVDAAVLH